MQNKNFYVYEYFDPIRKEPIYIGKGCKKRYLDHLNLKKRNKFINRIKWIRKQGQEPIVTKLHENLDEPDALTIEAFLIESIGRKDLGSGPLLNLTDGGVKTSRIIRSIQYKNKMSKSHIGLKASENTKKKLSLIHSGKNHHMFGKKHSFESRLKISNSVKNKVQGTLNPFFGKKHTKSTINIISAKLKGKIPWNKGLTTKVKISYGN